MTPDEPVVVDVEAPSRSGPPDGARVLAPLVGSAHCELALGGAVELPDRARRERGESRFLERARTRRPRVHQPSERREVGKVPMREQALQVGGHHERQRRPLLGDGVADDLGVETFEDDDVAPRQQCAERETQRRRVVQRRTDEENVVVVERPHVGLVLLKGDGVALGEDARPDSLRPARRAGGVVHGAHEWRRRQVGGWPVHEVGQLTGTDDELRIGVAQDDGSLLLEERRVHRHRCDANPGRAKDAAQHVDGVRADEGHPVTDLQTAVQKRPRDARLQSFSLVSGDKLESHAVNLRTAVRFSGWTTGGQPAVHPDNGGPARRNGRGARVEWRPHGTSRRRLATDRQLGDSSRP